MGQPESVSTLIRMGITDASRNSATSSCDHGPRTGGRADAGGNSFEAGRAGSGITSH